MFGNLVRLILDPSGVVLTCEGVGAGANDCATKASGRGVNSVKQLPPTRIVSGIEGVIANDRRNCHPGPIHQGSVPGPGNGAEPLNVPYV